MNQILPGLYLGSLDDSLDRRQIRKYSITHIITILETIPKKPFDDINYMIIQEEDSNLSSLYRYYNDSIEFIHKVRKVEKGNVLVHCYAGISRSAAIVIVYLMTCSDLSFESALEFARKQRKIVNPNHTFIRELQQYTILDLKENRQNLRQKYGEQSWKEDEQIILKKKMAEKKNPIQNFNMPISLKPK